MKTLKLIAILAILFGAFTMTSCKEKNKEIVLTESDLTNYYFQMAYTSTTNQQGLVMVTPDLTSGLKVHWHRLNLYRNTVATLTNVGTDGSGTLSVMGDDGNPIFSFNLRKDKDGKIAVTGTNFVGVWAGATSLSTKAQNKSEMSTFNYATSIFQENNGAFRLKFAANGTDVGYYQMNNGTENHVWTIGFYKLQGTYGFKVNNETVMGVITKDGANTVMVLDIGSGTLKYYTKM